MKILDLIDVIDPSFTFQLCDNKRCKELFFGDIDDLRSSSFLDFEVFTISFYYDKEHDNDVLFFVVG